jgi:hypothetical protein
MPSGSLRVALPLRPPKGHFATTEGLHGTWSASAHTCRSTSPSRSRRGPHPRPHRRSENIESRSSRGLRAFVSFTGPSRVLQVPDQHRAPVRDGGQYRDVPAPCADVDPHGCRDLPPHLPAMPVERADVNPHLTPLAVGRGPQIVGILASSSENAQCPRALGTPGALRGRSGFPRQAEHGNYGYEGPERYRAYPGLTKESFATIG